MAPKYRRQNRNVCDLVLIFSQNQILFFLEVKLFRSPTFNKCYGLYCDKTKLFGGRFQGHIVRGCWQALNHDNKATSTRTSKNNIQWWEILPFSDKEITPLKSSLSLGYNLRKRKVLQRRIVLVLLTAVDLLQTIMVQCMLQDQTIFLYNPPLCLPKVFRRSCLSL